MHEFKHGELHSGSKKGPLVKDRKQAIAIAMSEAKHAKTKALYKSKKATKLDRKHNPYLSSDSNVIYKSNHE